MLEKSLGEDYSITKQSVAAYDYTRKQQNESMRQPKKTPRLHSPEEEYTMRKAIGLDVKSERQQRMLKYEGELQKRDRILQQERQAKAREDR